MSVTTVDSIQEWFDTTSSQTISIWCDEPEVHTEARILGRSTYLTYRINCKQPGRDEIKIRHRYSEFEALRASLAFKYTTFGILVPSLPPKTTMASLSNSLVHTKADRSFVRERSLGLSLFCESIIASPWLRNDGAWKSFLLATKLGEDSKDNIGMQKLIETFSVLAPPDVKQSEEILKKLKVETEYIERHSKYLLDRLKSLQQAEKSYQQAQESVLSSLSIFREYEKSYNKHLNGKVFNDEESILKFNELPATSLSTFTNFFQQKVKYESEQSSHLGLTLVAAIEQQLNITESLKEVIKYGQEMKNMIESLTKKITKLEYNLTTITDAKKKESTENQIKDLTEQLNDKKFCLNTFNKGLIYFTIPITIRQRSGTLRKFISNYVSTKLNNSFQIHKISLEYFALMNISSNFVYKETLRMFSLLKLKNLAYLPEIEENLTEEMINNLDVKTLKTMGYLPKKGAEKEEEDDDELSYKSFATSDQVGQSFYLNPESNGMNNLFNRALKLTKEDEIKEKVPPLTIISNSYTPASTLTTVSSISTTEVAPSAPEAPPEEYEDRLTSVNLLE